jgi:hypothetical protein
MNLSKLNLPTAPKETFRFLLHALDTILDQGRTSKIKISLGSELVQIVFPNEITKNLISPPLQHLEVANPAQKNEKPCLTIYALDAASLGLNFSEFEWDNKNKEKQTGIYYLESEDFLSAFDLQNNIRSFLDLKSNDAIFLSEDIASIPLHLRSTPLLTIFNWWLPTQDKVIIHASAVGNAHGGVIITGKSGAGKSTLALACIPSNLQIAADDHCAISLRKPHQVFSLYSFLKQNANDVDRLPESKHAIQSQLRQKQEKVVYDLAKYYPNKIILSFPLKAILIPEITGLKDTSIQPISKIKALTAMAPTTLFQHPHGKQIAFEKISSIVKNTPAYLMRVGTEITQPPQVIESFLKEF